MPSLLDVAELDRRLRDLPGVHRERRGTLSLTVTAPTFPDAVRLVGLVAEQAEALNHHPDVDLRWRTVTFGFSTHSAGGVTELDLELARRALAASEEVGAMVLPPAQRVEIALDVADAETVLPFWRAALGYAPRGAQPGEEPSTNAGPGVELQDPAGRGPVLWFQRMDLPRAGRNRFHLDVYLPAEEVRARLDACMQVGGRLVTDEHAPLWWVLADAEGNEVCLCTA
ncbi:MAG TPA: 4a-hydroxytetrahydrobiopterin dehydratase [Kineosporiaceae bacterium]|nr:4a-hydroxytetrahydrobiopterin dehydratase [Kineosporiaceae bacterium]